MDRILSTRMDEAVIQRINVLAKKLGTSKKAVIENAINCFAEKIASETDVDIFSETSGSWTRDASAADTVLEIRETVRKSLERYKR